YLPRPDDPEAFGTELYSVGGVMQRDGTRTYYPEQDGLQCSFVKRVPFRPNSLLAFVNAVGAHAARIPESAPTDTARYAYQFYVGPDLRPFTTLLGTLPPLEQQRWLGLLLDEH